MENKYVHSDGTLTIQGQAERYIPGYRRYYNLDKSIGGWVHPTANINGDVYIGRRSIVEVNAYVGLGTIIGRTTKICNNAYLGCFSKIGNNCYIGQGSKLPEQSILGDGCSVRDNVEFKESPPQIIHNGDIIHVPGPGYIRLSILLFKFEECTEERISLEFKKYNYNIPILMKKIQFLIEGCKTGLFDQGKLIPNPE